MLILLFLIFHWYISLFFQTFFLHRYASHRMFKMNKFTEKICFFLTFISQGTSFLNPAAYALMHRDHHKYSDTVDDPHSPQSFTSKIKFNLKTFNEYRKYINKINASDIKSSDLPRWELIEKLSDSWITRISFAIIYTSVYIIYSPSFWYFLLLPIHFFMGPIHGFIVNWYGHKVGYRNFNLSDNSRNTLFIDFLMLGELYQNNHHKSPNNPDFSIKWFEVDFGYLILFFLKKLRIIK
ncbi:MAG: acyl-CoA desaturase [Candidatus Marinimicrobia bacterium]|nr:acyl-CoA desaturase [Candidatus Neomarinimicrobiota bacterium]